MEKIRMTCPCHFGLESVLVFELKKIGAEDIEASDGRVSFSGDFSIMARANLCLATAERVLIVLGEFRAKSFEELFQGVKKIALEDYIGVKDAFPVKGHALKSQLHSVPDCQSIIKKAAVERLKEKYSVNWFEETGSIHQIRFSILNDMVAIYLDTSGDGLHKRGYRRNSNAAPIKETLAAGIIDLARVRPNSVVCDPMCGSGTFLIESAFKALNIAPGSNRRFAAEKWSCIKAEIWKDERKRAVENVNRDAKFEAFGYDIDSQAVALTEENCRKAGVRSRIRVAKADIMDFKPLECGVTFCNPPYGQRLMELTEARDIYRTMGKVFQPTRDSRYFVISPDENFETQFGKVADKRRKLYNGMLKCQLYMYFK